MTVTWVGSGAVGRIVPIGEAHVSVLDHGFTVGDGVFETLLVRNGVPFATRRHLERLQRSCDGLSLWCPPADVLRTAMEAVVDQFDSGSERARLRITVTSGPGPLGSDRGDQDSTVVITCVPSAAWPSTTSIARVPWSRNETSATAGLKTTSYAENVIALASARRAGASEAVLANTRGELCEGTGTNVFVVTDGIVHTPPLSSGCLAGVTRELAIEWAADANIDVRESSLPYEVLNTADEVFLTSSTRDVHPVTAVDGRVLRVGATTELLRDLFLRNVARTADP